MSSWSGAATVLCLALSLAGCAVATAKRNAHRAELQEDYDQAVLEYTKVVRQRPNDTTARLELERAKLRAAQDHFARGRRLASQGKLDEALLEFQAASQLNPTAGEIETALTTTRTKLRAKVAVSNQGKTELQTLIDRTRDLPPPGLDLPTNVKLPDSLVFRDASSRDVFTALARFADVNVIFDPAFREAPVTIDLRNSPFDQAIQSVATSTRNFFRVTGQRTLTIIPDTPAKRREYEEEIVRTFYLSNADLKETIDLLRIVVDARRIAPATGANAITIKDTPERIVAAGRIISAIDKARPEVTIDVELLEVNRTKLLEGGLQLASPGSQGIDGQVSLDQQNLTVRDLRSITQAGLFLTNVPSLFYRLIKTDSNTRTLANPQLRTMEGITAQARFGEKVPVPTASFVPLAAGGVAQQPITSYTQQDIGVNIDLTPRVHHNDDVSLTVKMEVSSVSGTGYADLPKFGSRSINTVIRLKDGETSILAGLIRDDERRSLSGIPGLSDIPMLGRMFAMSKKETAETDVILTLTPHIIRVLDLTEADLRPFKVGRDATGPLLEFPPLELIRPAEPPKEEPPVPPKPIKD